MSFICLNCKNFRPKESFTPLFKCRAFPTGIPQVIVSGKNLHTKPLPNQKNKIVFEAIK